MISTVDVGESEQIEASIQVGIVRVALSLPDVLVDFRLIQHHTIDDLNVYERGFYERLLYMMFSCTEVHLIEQSITDIQIAILSYIDELIDGLTDSINQVHSPGIEYLTFPGRPPPKVEGHWPRVTMCAEFGERE